MSCRSRAVGLTNPRTAFALTLVFFAGTFVSAYAQGPNLEDNPLHTASRQELDVIKVLLAQEKAWNKGDINGFMQGFKESPETLFIARQVSKGYSEILAEYKHDYPNRNVMGQLGYSELEVHPLSEKFAVCLGHYHLERNKKDGGSAEGLFSLVLEETSQGWRIVVDHTT